MNRTWAVAGALVLGSFGAGSVPLLAESVAGRAWLHVRVEEGDSKVVVNLPMTVVEAALAAAPETLVREGRFQISGKKGISVTDMRKAWVELKSAGDTDLVTVEDKDETVRVSRRGDVVEVRVERPGSNEGVRVDVPVSLVDAAFSGESDSIEVKALFRELSKRRGDVVNVNEKDSKVRIWIDESNHGGGK